MEERELEAKWRDNISTDKAEISDQLWKDAKEQRYVQEALLEPELGLRDLVDFAEERLKYLRIGEGRRRLAERREPRKEIAFSLRGVEAQRAAALEEYLAKMATCDVGVYRFRRRVLGGQTISPEQAYEFINSPAARFLPTRLFEALDIPFVDHTATLENYRREIVTEGRRYRATISIDPPGIAKEVQTLVWAGTSKSEERGPKELEFPGKDGYVESIVVWGSALLGELRGLGDKLASRYRWQPAQAIWFVLTGEVAAVPSLIVRRLPKGSMYHRESLITLEVDSWVSAKTVYEAYRSAQLKDPDERGGRPLAEKNLRLFRFVVERTKPISLLEEGRTDVPGSDWMMEDELVANLRFMKVPKGRQLVEEWDRQYPQWAYGRHNTSNFWRDYQRAKRVVAYAVGTGTRGQVSDS